MTIHHEKLGRIVGVLQSLELTLRIYLLEIGNHRSTDSPGVDYRSLSVGDVVPEDELTNFDTLGKLVKKYNDDLTRRGDSELQIDEMVIDLRDMIAHGRILSLNQDMNQLKILKFSKRNADGMVTVTHAMDFNDEWYNQSAPIIERQRDKAIEAIRKHLSHVQLRILKAKG